MKIRILLSLFLVITPFFYQLKASTNVSGDQRGTWTKAGSPYIITGNIIVDSTLIIQPGVEVQFTNNNSLFTINGTLVAKGAVADSIRFTGTGGFGYGTETGPIVFASSSKNSVIQYAVITGLGYYFNSDYTAVIQINSSSCDVSNSYIGDVRGTAFEINNVTPVKTIIRNNKFDGPANLDIILDVDKLKCLSENDSLRIGLTHDNDMLLNDTLIPANILYRILANQVIPQGKTLTINAGTQVEFQNGASQLSVQGKLNARGTDGNPINFKGIGGFGYGTSTGPVIFEATSLTSVMDYVTVTGLGYYFNNDDGAAINVYSSFCTITNCNFNAIRGSAVLLGNIAPAQPVVRYCTFSEDISNLYVVADFDKLRYFSNNNPLRVGITHLNEMGRNDTLVYGNLFYRLLANQTIPPSKTLVVQQAVKLEFPNTTSQINIEGTLLTEGNIDNPVSFSGIGGFGYGTSTGPIIFEAGSKNSTLLHVNIDGLGYYFNSATTAGIVIKTSSCMVTNCFIQNTRGLAVQVQDSCAPSFRQSCFISNVNGAVRTVESRPSFLNCNFISNTAGIVNTTSDKDTITATNCWWGDISGPYVSGTNPDGAGDSLSRGVTYNPWATGPVDCSEDYDMPLTLIKFEARLAKNFVNCNWQTSSEINTSHFIVERSSDAINFTSIGLVRASVNSSIIKDYLFIDKAPGKNINYYRLKMVDQDGKYSYSNIEVVLQQSKSTIDIFPNPAKDIITIQYATEKPAITVKIYNTAGQLVKTTKLAGGTPYFTINISDIAKGFYVVNVNDGTTSVTHKFIKQ